MARRGIVAAIVCVICLSHSLTWADDAPLSEERVRDAIRRALPLLEKASAGSAEERTCFTCHNQAVPVFALTAARDRGFAIDEENLQRQLDHTSAYLTEGSEAYLEGRGQGGKALMAGYALWTLSAGGRKADETTAAVTQFLLQYQQDQSRWTHPGFRPPSSGSDFTVTFVALKGLTVYGTDSQQELIQKRIETVGAWLRETTPVDNEDRVFKLHALRLLRMNEELIKTEAKQLLERQQDDGSWPQTDDATGDVYATATSLYALLETGSLKTDSEQTARAARYLLDTQQEDGSWRVISRAKPFQTYYETGYPHGKDQFISVAAAGWATLALLRTLPPEKFED